MAISTDTFLAHHGILGQRWGVRRYQNPDGTLTDKGRRHLEKKDAKWATKGKGAKITESARKASSKEAEKHARTTVESLRTSRGHLSKAFINQYNQKLAELMNQKVGNISAPSGKVLRYVAKRGEVGVHTALADQEYNMRQVSKGIHASGRVAYRKTVVQRT